MGDRTYTTIKFSGEISYAQAEELIQELEGQGCRCDDPDTGELTVDQLADSTFYDSECNYAQMEGVENYCREQGIKYLKTWEPGGGYGSGIMLFNGTTDVECGTVDGEPALTLGQIKKLGIGMIGFLKSFDGFDEPLKIVGEPSEEEAA